MPWTNIPNANLAAGAPIRSVDTLALRDNIPALAAGDSGAPRVVDLAISDTVAAGSSYIPLQTGRITYGQSPNFTTLTLFGSAFIYRGGVANFRLKLYNGNTGEADGTKTLYARLYRDGVAISSELSASVPINSVSSFLTFSNISFSGQGSLQVYLRGPSLGYILGFEQMQRGVVSPVKIAPVALIASAF